MKPRPWWYSATQFIGIGWYIAAAIVVPMLLGVWFDRKAGTEPLFLLVGLLFGVTLAFYGTYKIASGFLTGGSEDGDNE